jgi:predicted nucleotidyltransferase
MLGQKSIRKLNFPISKSKIVKFCERWKVVELTVFGSAIRDDFNPEKSDVDLLVSFSEDAEWSLLDEVKMQEELKLILDKDVDLISKKAIESSKNWLRRDAILSDTKTIYAA